MSCFRWYNISKIVFCHLENVEENLKVFDLHLATAKEREMWATS